MCDPNVTRNDGKLVQTPWYSDRPHFATTAFYQNTVLPRIPEDARNTPEVILERDFVSLKTMWMYGMPGYQFHDINHMSWSHNMETRIENIVSSEAKAKANTPSSWEMTVRERKVAVLLERGDLVQKRQVQRKRKITSERKAAVSLERQMDGDLVQRRQAVRRRRRLA